MDKANKKPVVRRTEQEKLDLIVKWEKSGLPIKTFCLQHQFSDSIFHSWLNKYRRNNKPDRQQNSFIPLQVAGNCAVNEDSSCYAEIIMASGTRIKLY